MVSSMGSHVCLKVVWNPDLEKGNSRGTPSEGCPLFGISGARRRDSQWEVSFFGILEEGCPFPWSFLFQGGMREWRTPLLRDQGRLSSLCSCQWIPPGFRRVGSEMCVSSSWFIGNVQNVSCHCFWFVCLLSSLSTGRNQDAT